MYDKVGVLYSRKLGNRSEARASDLRSHPGLWWNRIKQRLYEGKESEYSPRTCSIGRPAGGTLCPHPVTLQMASSAGQKPCTAAQPCGFRIATSAVVCLTIIIPFWISTGKSVERMHTSERSPVPTW